jgi:hypothetical protein
LGLEQNSKIGIKVQLQKWVRYNWTRQWDNFGFGTLLNIKDTSVGKQESLTAVCDSKVGREFYREIKERGHQRQPYHIHRQPMVTMYMSQLHLRISKSSCRHEGSKVYQSSQVTAQTNKQTKSNWGPSKYGRVLLQYII